MWQLNCRLLPNRPRGTTRWHRWLTSRKRAWDVCPEFTQKKFWKCFNYSQVIFIAMPKTQQIYTIHISPDHRSAADITIVVIWCIHRQYLKSKMLHVLTEIFGTKCVRDLAWSNVHGYQWHSVCQKHVSSLHCHSALLMCCHRDNHPVRCSVILRRLKHFIFNILKKGCGHNQLGQQVAAILTPVFTRTHFCSQTWNDLVPGCKLLMALTDLFLSGVSSSLEPVLWRTSSSTNKLRRNRCRNSRDRKCSQQWKNISQILRNPENECSETKHHRNEVRVLLFFCPQDAENSIQAAEVQIWTQNKWKLQRKPGCRCGSFYCRVFPVTARSLISVIWNQLHTLDTASFLSTTLSVICAL